MQFLFGKANKSDKSTSNPFDLTSDGYIVLGHIANGSYGEVRHAKYVYGETEVNMVVKIIDTNQTSKEYVSKFLPRELDVIKKINHPYIIHVHSILQKKAILFLFMEYAIKGELLEYILHNGPLKENQARIWFRQLVLAVQYLHTMDIVHRDIKCENILLNEHFKIKLTDFGFSKIINRGKRLNCHTYCCSLGYASPEVLSSRPYDGKSSDIWSLGVVLYVMLNKKMPFSRKNIKIMYKQQVKRDWDHQPSIENIISVNVKKCIDNLLQPEPRKRWTIDKVLTCEWIKMNQKLANLNEHETIAFVEALHMDRKDNQRQLKNIEANRSDIQRHLNERPQRYLSLEPEVDSEIKAESLERDESSTSRYKLRRSQRIMDTCNFLVSNNSFTDKNNLKPDPVVDKSNLKLDLVADKSNLKLDSIVNIKDEKHNSNSNEIDPKHDSNKNEIDPKKESNTSETDPKHNSTANMNYLKHDSDT